MSDFETDICSLCGQTIDRARFHLWGRGPMHERCNNDVHERLMRATTGLTPPADVPGGAVTQLIEAAKAAEQWILRSELKTEPILDYRGQAKGHMLSDGAMQVFGILGNLRDALRDLGIGDGQ